MGQIGSTMVGCTPLGIHFEPINRVNAVSDNIIIAIWPKRELEEKKEALWANGTPYELIKNSDD